MLDQFKAEAIMEAARLADISRKGAVTETMHHTDIAKKVAVTEAACSRDTAKKDATAYTANAVQTTQVKSSDAVRDHTVIQRQMMRKMDSESSSASDFCHNVSRASSPPRHSLPLTS